MKSFLIVLSIVIGLGTELIIAVPSVSAYERHDDAYYCGLWRSEQMQVVGATYEQMEKYCKKFGI